MLKKEGQTNKEGGKGKKRKKEDEREEFGEEWGESNLNMEKR